MKVTWTLILLLGSAGVLCADECDPSHVEQCYDALVHYEGLGFPLYGKDEEELNETCETMTDSFECIEAYWHRCNGSATCEDEDCSQMLNDIENFSLHTGLRNVQKELCSPGATREAYLENYSCLASNAEYYAACHNDSQMSQDYMSTIKKPAQAIAARCCFFTWYHDCFTNITRNTCNDNATFFVSIVLHNFITHISDQMCGKSPDVCDKPPLPPTHQEDDTIHHKNVDTDQEDDTIPLDDGHKDITDVDNDLDEDSKNDAAHKFSLWTLCITFIYISLSVYFI